MLEANPKSVPRGWPGSASSCGHPELAAKSAEAAKAGGEASTLAEYELAEALKLAPGDAEARMLAAEDAVPRGDTTAARAHLAAIDPPPKDDLAVKLIKGMIEFREQRPDEGMQSCAHRADPDRRHERRSDTGGWPGS